MRLIVSILFGCAALCCACTKKTAPDPHALTLKVGTNAEFAPFSFIEDHEIKGFEIDIAQEVCNRLGCKMELRDLPFDALIPELEIGALHFVAAGMSVTPEREKVVNFSTPYLSANPLVALYVDEEKTLSFQDLKHLRIVVNEGYIADPYVSGELGITPLRLQNPTEAMLALKSKRADVFVTAQSTVAPLISVEKRVHFAFFQIEKTSENCALMISKKYPEVGHSINRVLAEMEGDGTMLKLKTKWQLP